MLAMVAEPKPGCACCACPDDVGLSDMCKEGQATRKKTSESRRDDGICVDFAMAVMEVFGESTCRVDGLSWYQDLVRVLSSWPVSFVGHPVVSKDHACQKGS
jgi:hypothetical protein